MHVRIEMIGLSMATDCAIHMESGELQLIYNNCLPRLVKAFWSKKTQL